MLSSWVVWFPNIVSVATSKKPQECFQGLLSQYLFQSYQSWPPGLIFKAKVFPVMKASYFAHLPETQQLHKVTVWVSSIKFFQGWGTFPVRGLAGWLPHMLIALACLSAQRPTDSSERIPKKPLSKEEWTLSRCKANRILVAGGNWVATACGRTSGKC